MTMMAEPVTVTFEDDTPKTKLGDDIVETSTGGIIIVKGPPKSGTSIIREAIESGNDQDGESLVIGGSETVGSNAYSWSRGESW